MNLPLLGIISTIYLFHHLGFAVTSNSIAAYHPSDEFALNCGSSGNLFAFDGREWIGDIIFNSKCTSSQEPKGKSLSLKTVHQLLFVDPVPYMTARISRSQFTYTFQLRPGQKFIRLHFHPASYPGFDRSKALFTVKAGPYTLLSNFSASLAADALGVKYFAKEFCVNIEESQLFSITFSPSSYGDDVYAFINGIEIVSMPAGLYYTPDRDLGANVVGKTFRFYIDNSTKGSSIIIGKGGFGNVYKGLIDNQTKTVAIKRLKSESKQGADEFWMEIETLSTFRHVHLVSLIGYCDDSQEMLLVYEYMTNGTLADHLYKTRRNIGNNSPLSWEQRLNICIGSARGLAYLHTSRGAHHGVIHRDVKSSNILLDKNWVAKISDFGLSKIENAGESHTHISTDVKGTFGYLDPEYFLTRRLTKKSDVYAFGVVLFEVLCGRPAVDVRLEEEQHSLALWAKRCITEGTLDQIVDPSVREQISPHCLKVFAEIASKCLHNNPNERLTMADVVAGLEYSLQPEEKAYSYIDQEIVLPGDASPQTSRHYTMQLTRRESVEDIASGTNKGKKICRRKEDYNSNRGPSWGRLWDLLWYRMRPPKAKPSPLPEVVFPLPELPCRRFSLAEIRAATNNFSKVIKDGPYCKVYMGYTDTMKKVSIEWLTSREQSVDEFCMEVRMLSQPQCTNVVSLVGYCYDELEMILVYEYMNNGTLFDHLHNTTNNSFLSLEERLRICIRAARGLNYLHTCAEQRIHGSISSSNILLDSNWIAKISNIGCLRDPMRQSFSHTRRLFLDTAIGYLHPEFWLTGTLTERTDVFAFGVVLFEVLSGRRAVDMELENEQRYLCKLARDCVHSGTVHQIIDPYLIGKISTHCLSVFVEIARNCVFLGGTERPQIHMSDVVRNLELALELQQIGDGQSWYSEESQIYSDEW